MIALPTSGLLTLMKEASLAFWSKITCKIHLVNGSDHDTVEIKEKKIIIGRKAEHTISINDTSISRDHLQITIEKDAVIIEDMGSSNGSFLNGVPLVGFQPTPYLEGQPIILGKCPINIFIELPR